MGVSPSPTAIRDYDQVLHLKEQQLHELLQLPTGGSDFVHTAGVELPAVFLAIVKHLNAVRSPAVEAHAYRIWKPTLTGFGSPLFAVACL